MTSRVSRMLLELSRFYVYFQAEDCIRYIGVTGVQTCALPIFATLLMAKDRVARMGPAGWAMRSDYMGVGLTGRTLGLLGVGNIGAEVLRLAAPLDMRFIDRKSVV